MILPKDKQTLKQEFYSWLNNNQQHLKPVISDAIESLYRVQQENYDEKDVQNIKKGLMLNHLNSWAIADYVNDFAKKDEIFIELIKELAKHPSAKVRLNITTNCLLHNRIEQVTDEILTNALNDKSKQVRSKAVDVLGRLNKETHIPELQKRIEIETDEKIKNEMQQTLELLDRKWSLDSNGKNLLIALKSGSLIVINLNDYPGIKNTEWIEKKVKEVRKDEFSV